MAQQQSDAAQQIAEFCADIEHAHLQQPDRKCEFCGRCWPCAAIRGVRALRAMLALRDRNCAYVPLDALVAVAAALRED